MDNMFRIDVRTNDFSNILLSGDLDIQTSMHMNDFFESVISQCTSDLTIDCEKLTYIDSCGISILLRAVIKMKQKDFRIRLINMKKNTRKLFEITRLDSTFNLNA